MARRPKGGGTGEYASFGRLLRRLRLEAPALGVRDSLEQVALTAGGRIASGTLSRYENGQHIPPTGNVLLIARLYGVDRHRLLDAIAAALDGEKDDDTLYTIARGELGTGRANRKGYDPGSHIPDPRSAHAALEARVLELSTERDALRAAVESLDDLCRQARAVAGAVLPARQDRAAGRRTTPRSGHSRKNRRQAS